MNFLEVRQNLLNEAISSPNLLSDLAGLENYIAESYNNRSFIELLQNADDANASKFKIFKKSGFLYVANNGKIFSQSDLESLCRSASSKKLRGETIGYRGIGFKSVVGFAKEIFLFSGDLEIKFSKDLTKNEILQADRVPLIRIPHFISDVERRNFSNTINELKDEGFSTVFVFTEITINEIENEFDSFKYNSLLFLKNIRFTEINLNNPIVTEVIKTPINDSQFKSTLNSNNQHSSWLISNYNNTSFAFFLEDKEVKKLSNDDALIHAFLPTEDVNGLGVLINGNFSTDPSRRHLIFDDETKETIHNCALHFMQLLKDCLENKNVEIIDNINSILPHTDPRMVQYSKNSFIKILLDQLMIIDINYFKQIKLPINWLNLSDSIKLTSNIEHLTFYNKVYSLNGFISLLKYLGARESKFDEIKDFINTADISILGCVQITKYIFKSILTFSVIKENDFLNLKILFSNGIRKSINDLKDGAELDHSFITLLIENGLTEFDLNQVFKKYSISFKSKNETKTLESKDLSIIKKDEIHSIKEWLNTSNHTIPKLSVKRWRSAEEQTLEILNLNGFKLEDVSKQNIGYDLSGFDPFDNVIQIEVKSITYPGQKFRLTNNEIAVAQIKQSSYYVAIVRQTDEYLEIALISDPVNNLSLNRQCVQWIWECESYDFKPLKFDLK
jgi:hypothetical protein